MNKLNNQIKSILLPLLVPLFLLIQGLFDRAQAVCPQGIVPNPMDPNCTGLAAGGNQLTFGVIINRFLPLIPIGITFITVFSIVRGGVKIALAEDAEARQAGFKGIINAAIGAALFYSLWMILYIIEQVTGVNLIQFGR